MSHQLSGPTSESDAPSAASGGQPLPPGTQVDGYVIDGVLGSNRFSISYLGRDIRHGSSFVLKENFPVFFTFRNLVTLNAGPLDIDGGDAESFAWSVENFEREAKMLASVFHPGVVRVMETFRSFGTAFYVMPLVEGSSLDEQISQRLECGLDFLEEEITGLLWRMLNALECLHDQGICHLDIRPENILITDQGIPCLKNFGAAKQHLCERFLTVVESSGYTPPEQLVKGELVGPWSDLFALAASLRAAITGVPPSAEMVSSVNHSVTPVSGRLELEGRYSPALLASIDRAMDPVISARFRCVSEWREALWNQGENAQDRGTKELKTDPEAAVIDARHSSSILKEKGIMKVPAPRDNEVRPGDSKIAESTALTTAEDDILISSMIELDFSELIPAESDKRPAFSVLRIGVAVMVIAGLVGFLTWKTPPTPKPIEIPYSQAVESSATTIAAVNNPEPARSTITSAGIAPTSIVEMVPEQMPVAPVDASLQELEGSEAGKERVFEGIAMSWCPPGEFQMGSPWNEKGRFQDETPHQVHLTQGFWIAKTELTQGQWKQAMGNNPSMIQRENLPVDQVDWSDVQRWMEKMNQDHPPAPGWKWALPTEAQWEYACRAGTTTPIYSGPMEILGERNAPALDTIAWYGGNSSVGYVGEGFDTSVWPEKQYPGGKAGVREVGGKLPNAWGLFDMLGNVWEWCADWYDAYPIGSVTDPSGPPTGSTRAMRGGSWGNGAVVCRSAVRGEDSPENRGEGLGFRCVIVPVEP